MEKVLSLFQQDINQESLIKETIMVYGWAQLGIKEITNLFSYGGINTPSDRAGEERRLAA